MSEEKSNTDDALRPMSRNDSADIRSSEVGLAGTLFLSLLELFRSLKNSIDKNASWSAHDVVAFQEELESYLLWGAHYDTTTGKLDRILIASSRELRDGVLSYIGNIGQILCIRMSNLAFYSVNGILGLFPCERVGWREQNMY